MKQNEYTISILTEDKPGLLNKITIMFNRRKINIMSLNVSVTEIKGVSRYTMVVKLRESEVIKIVNQIRNVIDILGSFYYVENEIYHREIALYKISAKVFNDNNELNKIIKDYDAKIIASDDYQVVIEKTGSKEQTHKLYEELKNYDLLEFVRSGRIALSKSKRRTEAFVRELENSSSNTLSIKEF